MRILGPIGLSHPLLMVAEKPKIPKGRSVRPNEPAVQLNVVRPCRVFRTDLLGCSRKSGPSG
jgi:hypothetical protein